MERATDGDQIKVTSLQPPFQFGQRLRSSSFALAKRAPDTGA